MQHSSEHHSLALWYFVPEDDESTPPSQVNVPITHNIDGLKKAINKERLRLGLSMIPNMVLLKPRVPILIAPVETLEERIKDSNSVTLGNPSSKVSKEFPEPPADDFVHIIVKTVTRPKRSFVSCEPVTVSQTPSKKPKLEEDPVNCYVSRHKTVSALYEKLRKRRWIHVRGTPGSGKSVLASLLCRYINEQEPDTEVILINAWPENQKVQTIHNTILILDEAHTTYGDKAFWSRFKNPGLQNVRVVAFASHGSSGYTCPDKVTPMWIGKEQRVGLTRLDCGDGILVGLLLTREEFNALVQLRFRDRRFSDTFLDCVYDMTNGHVGACQDLMNMVIAHESYRLRVKSAEYTYEMFMTGVPMTDIPQAIYRGTVSNRGLPQAQAFSENSDMTAVMSEVIRKGSIVCPYDYLASDPDDDDNRRAALRKIFRSGWLHTEIREDIDGILYTFASPLHRRCIDWKLNGSPLESRIIEQNLFEFALAVIQRFSRQSLVPEAQFQEGFYAACSKVATGSVSFPEFGTKSGRIDFFIRSKKWGVELLCDGNRLSQHARRFTEGEYGTWIEKGWMSDYIIIDFCTQRPKIYRDVDKLIYVVSIDDWKTVEVLDNGGNFIHRYGLLNY